MPLDEDTAAATAATATAAATMPAVTPPEAAPVAPVALDWSVAGVWASAAPAKNMDAYNTAKIFLIDPLPVR